MDNTAQRKDLWLAGAATQHECQRLRKAKLLADSVRNFCEIDRPSRQEVDMFKELFYQLIGGCGKSERRLLAASLARNVYTPRQILMYFALDSVDVAAAVLLFSPGINEFDILTLAGRLSIDHLKVLCRRHDLSQESANALRKAGGSECAELLAKNPALKRDNRACESHMRQGDDSRAEQRDKPAVELNPFMREPQAQKAGETKNITEDLVELAGRGGRTGRKREQFEKSYAYDPAIPMESQLLKAARTGRKDGLAGFIESYCGIRSAIISQLLDEPDAEVLCVVLKGLGVNFVTTLQLLLLLNRQVASSRQRYEEIKSLITSVDFNECRRFLEEIGGRFGAIEPEAPSRAASLMEMIASRRQAVSPLAQRHENRTSELRARPLHIPGISA